MLRRSNCDKFLNEFNGKFPEALTLSSAGGVLGLRRSARLFLSWRRSWL